MKVRLVKGPFSGKVLDHPQAGANTIVIRGPKPMSRKQRYEYERDYFSSHAYSYANPMPRIPTVHATYQIATRLHRSADGQTLVMLYYQHPDGSLFYEFTGNKKEYP